MTETENETRKMLVSLTIEDTPIFCAGRRGDCAEESIYRYDFSNAFYLSHNHLECAVCGSGKVMPNINPDDEVWILDPRDYGSTKRITGRMLRDLLDS